MFHGEAFRATFLRSRSHCSVFVLMRFCCIKATRSHYSVFVQKLSEKYPFLCVHIDLPNNKYRAKDFRFCAVTLLHFCEAHRWMLQRFQKPPLLCVHIDLERVQKPPFMWISNFDRVLENLRFCGVFVRISVRTFSKTAVFLSVFVQKRCCMNGA